MNIVKFLNNQTEMASSAAEIISKDGLVILPFDTVYGIVCNPKSENAVSKLFKFKNRPDQATIGLCFSNIKIATDYVELKKNQFEYASERLPGKITLIAKAKPETEIDPRCQRGETIGFRVPDSELILAATEAAGGVLAQTSANKHGAPNCYSVKDLESQFSKTELEQIDLIVDGGELSQEGASQIIDLTTWPPKTIERG